MIPIDFQPTNVLYVDDSIEFYAERHNLIQLIRATSDLTLYPKNQFDSQHFDIFAIRN